MLKTRVIPVLLLHKQGLVKTKKFKDIKYIGDPINSIRIFNEKEADELILLDIDKSKERNQPDYELIESFASECFMPLCYGGGITTIEQMKKIFRIGIEKISLNTSALNDEALLREAVTTFGSQSIVVSIDIKKDIFGNYRIYDHSQKKIVKKNLLHYIEQLNTISVGEILVNSVDRDGTQLGYDIDLLMFVAEHTNIPLIACGGAKNMDDFKKVKTLANVSAVAASSFFLFHGKHRAVLITYPKYSELEKLFDRKGDL